MGSFSVHCVTNCLQEPHVCTLWHPYECSCFGSSPSKVQASNIPSLVNLSLAANGRNNTDKLCYDKAAPKRKCLSYVIFVIIIYILILCWYWQHLIFTLLSRLYIICYSFVNNIEIWLTAENSKVVLCTWLKCSCWSGKKSWESMLQETLPRLAYLFDCEVTGNVRAMWWSMLSGSCVLSVSSVYCSFDSQLLSRTNCSTLVNLASTNGSRQIQSQCSVTFDITLVTPVVL